MKIRIIMKTPDAISEAAENVYENEKDKEKFAELCERWFNWGEYVELEVDTKKKTCIVVENSSEDNSL